jgi:hypothetical protein
MHISQPASIKAMAMAAPIPCEAPVTKTFFLTSDPILGVCLKQQSRPRATVQLFVRGGILAERPLAVSKTVGKGAWRKRVMVRQIVAGRVAGVRCTPSAVIMTECRQT